MYINKLVNLLLLVFWTVGLAIDVSVGADGSRKPNYYSLLK